MLKLSFMLDYYIILLDNNNRIKIPQYLDYKPVIKRFHLSISFIA